MANITPQKVALGGLDAAFVAADALGDTLPPVGKGMFIVKNGSASAVTVTIETPGTTRFGVAQPDIDVSVPAGEERYIGPLVPELNDSVAKGIKVSYSAVASVTVAVVEV